MLPVVLLSHRNLLFDILSRMSLSKQSSRSTVSTERGLGVGSRIHSVKHELTLWYLLLRTDTVICIYLEYVYI